MPECQSIRPVSYFSWCMCGRHAKILYIDGRWSRHVTSQEEALDLLIAAFKNHWVSPAELGEVAQLIQISPLPELASEADKRARRTAHFWNLTEHAARFYASGQKGRVVLQILPS